MKKTSTLLFRYDIKPEEKSIIWKSRNEPEWQLYLVEEKEIYVSEFTKPSEFFKSENRVRLELIEFSRTKSRVAD